MVLENQDITLINSDLDIVPLHLSFKQMMLKVKQNECVRLFKDELLITMPSCSRKCKRDLGFRM
jgi:hypothetical protein